MPDGIDLIQIFCFLTNLALSMCLHCRYREKTVADVVHQHKAKMLNSPIYIWQGGFRDQISYPDPERRQVLWKPTGLAKNSPYSCY